MGFTRTDLEGFRDREVPDLLPAPGADLRLLFVGINPGLWTAAAGAHFARPGNRFWPALHLAGILPRNLDVSAGMTADDHDLVVGLGVGITNLAPRATARADEVTRAELASGRERLVDLVRRRGPRVVAVLGVTAYRAAFAVRTARAGRQEAGLGTSALWVLPNPSGLNAHETVTTLAAAYRGPAVEAGLVPTDG